MKILSIGLDNSILDKNSALARRAVEYGNLAEKYAVIVPSREKAEIELSGKVKAYGSGGGNKLARMLKIYKLAEKLSRAEKYDIITCQDQYYLALLGLQLSKKFKTGLEIQIHGWEKFAGFRKIIAKYVLPRADSVRCVSQRLKKMLIGEFGVNEEKITVAPIYSDTILSLRAKNPPLKGGAGEVNLTPLIPLLKGDNNGAGKFVFLTVGRLVAVKNIGMQIEAMREVAGKYPETELWIIGDGPELAKLKAESGKLKVEKNIKFLGWKKDIDEYYDMADAFVLTSDSEGWGLAAIEAAGRGLPIIMTDVGCAGEVIKNDESGLVIPVGDKKKLVESMIEILKNSELRKKLGENGRLAVSRLPEKEQIFNLYKKSWEIAAMKMADNANKPNPRIFKLEYFFLYLLGLINFLAARFYMNKPPFIFADSKSYYQAMMFLKGLPVEGVLPLNRLLTTPLMLDVSLFLNNFIGDLYSSMLAANIVFYCLITAIFYKLAYLIYKSRAAAFAGSVLFLSNYYIINFGLAYLSDMGGWMFFALSTLFAVKYFQTKSDKFYYLSVFSSSFGFLFKEYGAVGIASLGMLILFSAMPWRKKIKKIIFAGLLFAAAPIIYHVFFYWRFHYSYFDWYLFNMGKYVYSGNFSSLSYRLFLSIKVLGWLFSLGWPVLVCGLYQEKKHFDKDRAKILLCLLPASFMFFLWPALDQRIAFIFVLWLALIAGFGLSKIRNKYFVVFVLLAYILINYNIKYLLEIINLPF
ncbi:MAG: glycosyltransferase [bacterium]